MELLFFRSCRSLHGLNECYWLIGNIVKFRFHHWFPEFKQESDKTGKIWIGPGLKIYETGRTRDSEHFACFWRTVGCLAPTVVKILPDYKTLLRSRVNAT